MREDTSYIPGWAAQESDLFCASAGKRGRLLRFCQTVQVGKKEALLLQTVSTVVHVMYSDDRSMREDTSYIPGWAAGIRSVLVQRSSSTRGREDDSAATRRSL